jgi:hypothetical protein
MFTFIDGAILGLSLITLALVVVKARPPFKKHSMNIFTHLMLVLIIFGLLGKYLRIKSNYLQSEKHVFPDHT